MKITVNSNAVQGEARIFLFTAEETPVPPLTATEFKGAARTAATFFVGEERRIASGLGHGAKVGDKEVREAVGVAVRLLQSAGIVTATLEMGRWTAHAGAAVEGAILGGYQFDTFIAPPQPAPVRFQHLNLAVSPDAVTSVRQRAKRGATIADSVNYTRSLGDLPGNYVTPETLAQAALDLGREVRALKVKVLDQERLESGGFGGITAVGAGSVNPPRLILVEYRGGKASEAPVALVGKAVTFDSGGISIKPADRMDEMKFDKMGGCTVLGILRAAALLGIRQNIVGVIPAVENLLDGRSYRPGDIVTTYDGKAIEVLNTDAEGRIILADALAYARIHYRPRRMLDFATLTGAIVVALGGAYTGFFSNDDTVAEALASSATVAGEKLWRMPLDADYHEVIKSEVALVKNTGGREGGSCTAAAFLEKWVESVPWAHFDIAGTAWNTRALPHQAKGASGAAVRTVIEWLEKA
jgi:leucyl aminopeptidase